MRCEEVQNAFADDWLSPEARTRVESHTRGCTLCRQAQTIYFEIDRTLGSEPFWQPPADFPSRVASIVDFPRLGDSLELRFFLRLPLAAIGGILLVLILAFDLQAFQQFADSYERFVQASLEAMAANPVLTAWISAAFSLWISARYTLRALP